MMTNVPKLVAECISYTSKKAFRAKGRCNSVSNAQSQPLTPVELSIEPIIHSGNDSNDGNDDNGNNSNNSDEFTRNIFPKAKSSTLVCGLFFTIFHHSHYSYLMPF
jgi:hypothetical protein